MSKKLCAVFAVMLCLTAVLPAVSMSTGCAGAENNPKLASGELKIDAWVENKITKGGDLIEVYATTSYNAGVSVSAKIVKYSLETYGGTTIPLPAIIGTISLTYNALESRWEGEYQIPGDLHELYGVEVTATDGSKTAKDSPVEEMMSFYLEHLLPVIQKWETFKQNQLEPTVEYVNQSIHDLSTTIEGYGGLKGIVKDLNSLPAWKLFLGAGYQNYNTMQTARFLDALTNFILSSEYDQLISIKPELKSLFENITKQALIGKSREIINYMAEYDFTNILTKIAGSENIVSAYQALISSSDYTNFLNALDALKAALTEENFENVASALQQLSESTYLQELLLSIAQYLQGDQTSLQELIQSWVGLEGVDVNAQISALGSLPEFQSLRSAIMQDANLSVVYNSINNTYNNLVMKVRLMAISSELQALSQSLQEILEYMKGCEFQVSESFYDGECFGETFTVADWVEEMELQISTSLWGGYMEPAGQVSITLTDPNGVEYNYAYNESVWLWEFICDPTPGNWSANVTTTGSGYFNLKTAPKQDFPVYMFLEILDELFFVLNAGIAIETDTFAQIGTNATAKLIAYDVDGKLPNTPINVGVVRSPFESLLTTAVLYAWMSGVMVPSGGIQVRQEERSSVTTEMLSPEMIGLLQLLDTLKTETVYEGTVTTNVDGEYTITFPVDNYGSYSIYAYLQTDTKLGFGTANVFCEQDVPEIALQKLGEFSGIPVYKSPNKVGEDITLSIDVPQDAQAAAFVAPLPLKERYPEINVTYDPSYNFTNVTGNITLQVNGPVSIIGIVSGNLGAIGPVQEEYPLTYLYVSAYSGDVDDDGEYDDVCIYVYDRDWNPVADASVYIDGVYVGLTDSDGVFYGHNYSAGTYSVDVWYGDVTASTTFEIYETRSVDTSSVMQSIPSVPSIPQIPAIPQINVSYGILLASDVDVTLTIPTLVKGGTSTICLSAQGTIGNTSGLAFYSNGTDFTAFDLSLFSKLIYRYGILGKEPSSETEVLELLSGVTGIVWGTGATANVKLPTLCAYGGYSIITVSAVNSQFGVGFAQASFYKNLTVARPIATANDPTIKYYVCTAPINKRYVISTELPAPSQKTPTGKKMVGMGLELNTTGTFGEAFITINYTDAEIAGLDENSLRMYYWNETTNEWLLIPDSGVWTNNNTVWARVTHLTIFAPMAEEVAAVPALLGPMIYTGVIAAIIAVLIVSVAVAAKRRKKVI